MRDFGLSVFRFFGFSCYRIPEFLIPNLEFRIRPPTSALRPPTSVLWLLPSDLCLPISDFYIPLSQVPILDFRLPSVECRVPNSICFFVISVFRSFRSSVVVPFFRSKDNSF